MRRIVLLVSITVFSGITASSAIGGRREVPDSCTIAEPTAKATVEARLPGAPDFCELTSQGLAGDVFHAPTLVTANLWHYEGATLSCRLEYRHSPEWITIHGSALACNWFKRRATGWHAVPATTE
jgi:hypothetical protein